MKLTTLLLAAQVIGLAQALHFYFDSSEKRCFVEELPSDTVVEGKYGALVWDDGKQSWEADPGLQVRVNVEDLSSAQVVVNTKGPHTGTFTFSSHEAADHQICLSTEGVGSGHKHVKMYLDVNVGPSKHDKESDQRHIGTLAGKLNELNKKVADIQREQRYMREVEEQFRDLSEATNARAVWYCIAQIVVLVAAGVWQMRHLKVYFEDKKLR
ncbi:ER to transport-related protein [Trichosporon asahii var. asahii CBS 8904]|uniref:ER to transport-related protein n=1 Tax=Trichosporon asahii var. asahii (strain CBS 8904) TaxID=1220162 RepID=K1VNZ3_TRIAC|nr:ER to transport-related protein [Trichosporon asahii var. asahii CBS 8904]